MPMNFYDSIDLHRIYILRHCNCALFVNQIGGIMRKTKKSPKIAGIINRSVRWMWREIFHYTVYGSGRYWNILGDDFIFFVIGRGEFSNCINYLQRMPLPSTPPCLLFSFKIYGLKASAINWFIVSKMAGRKGWLAEPRDRPTWVTIVSHHTADLKGCLFWLSNNVCRLYYHCN